MATRDLIEVRCDRCAKTETHPRINDSMPEGWEELTSGHLGDIHLCPACLQGLKQWLASGKHPRPRRIK